VQKTFITVDDIVTADGHPFQYPDKLHCRTLLVFTFSSNSELCQALAAASRDDSDSSDSSDDNDDDDDDKRRRRREVVGFGEVSDVFLDENQNLLDRSIVYGVADYPT